MPAHYKGFGISLLYPENWQMDEQFDDDDWEDDDWDGSGSVTFESPTGAFMTINRFEPSQSPIAAVSQAESAMAREYDQVESEPLTREIGDRQMHGVIQRFFYLDLIIVSQLLGFTVPDGTYLIQIQGESRDIDQLSPVFDAMLVSMVKNLNK